MPERPITRHRPDLLYNVRNKGRRTLPALLKANAKAIRRAEAAR